MKGITDQEGPRAWNPPHSRSSSAVWLRASEIAYCRKAWWELTLTVWLQLTNCPKKPLCCSSHNALLQPMIIILHFLSTETRQLPLTWILGLCHPGESGSWSPYGQEHAKDGQQQVKKMSKWLWNATDLMKAMEPFDWKIPTHSLHDFRDCYTMNHGKWNDHSSVVQLRTSDSRREGNYQTPDFFCIGVHHCASGRDLVPGLVRPACPSMVSTWSLFHYPHRNVHWGVTRSSCLTLGMAPLKRRLLECLFIKLSSPQRIPTSTGQASDSGTDNTLTRSHHPAGEINSSCPCTRASHM